MVPLNGLEKLDGMLFFQLITASPVGISFKQLSSDASVVHIYHSIKFKFCKRFDSEASLLKNALVL
jgi:hypothetical protein